MRHSLLQAFCIVCFIITLYCGFYFTVSISEADQMRTIDLAGRNLLIALLDAETGQRGFIITDDDRYLDPYNAGLAAIPSRMQELRNAAANTEQVKRIDDIGTITKQKLNELDRTISMRRTVGYDKTAVEVDTHIGKNLMDMIRQHLDEVELWSDRTYRSAEDQAIWYGRIGFVAMLLTIISGLIVVLRERY